MIIKVIKIFALSLLMSACVTGAPPIPYTGPAVSEVFEVADNTGAQIYEGSRQWIAENFKSAKAVIEYESRDTLTIIGNGTSTDRVVCLSQGYINMQLTSMCANPGTMGFTVKVEAKDGRMRISVPSITLHSAAGWDKPANQEAYALLSKRVLRYGDDITAYIVNGANDDF